MDIETRLNLVITFIKTNQTATETDLIDYLVSNGDTQLDAENAIPIYIKMLYDFGYILNNTYDAMVTWAVAISTTVLSNASSTLLKEYYNQQKLLKLEQERLNLISSYDEQILNLKNEISLIITLEYPTNASNELIEAIDDYNLKKENEKQELIIELSDAENKRMVLINNGN